VASLPPVFGRDRPPGVVTERTVGRRPAGVKRGERKRPGTLAPASARGFLRDAL